MDIFVEQLVKHKRTNKDYLIIAGTIIVAILLIGLGFALCFLGALFRTLYPLIVLGIGYFAFLMIRKTNIEYEYILTNNELDIDMITAKSARKRVITINFSNIDICAKVSDAEHKSEYNSFPERVIDCIGDGKTDIYFVDFYDGEIKTRVLFQPMEKIIDNVYKFNPRKIVK